MKKIIAIIITTCCLFNTFSAFAEDSKPIFATITSSWCASCKQFKPVLEELEYIYWGKVDFVTFDTSTKESIESAKQKASELGIIEFFNKNKSNLPTVGIFCSKDDKVGRTFTAETRRAIYESVLDSLVNQNNKHICSGI